jgi:hypothetical protein
MMDGPIHNLLKPKASKQARKYDQASRSARGPKQKPDPVVVGHG